MDYYGNYQHLIKDKWIEILLSTKGIEISPFQDNDDSKDKKEKNIDQTLANNSAEEDLFKNGPYDDNLIMAEIFDNRNCPFELDLGDLNKYLQGDWWIVKQAPGQFMPLHRDTTNVHDDNHRFWMPWKDYEAGHVFIHENKFITNYKCGDLYRYDKDNDLHGSVNIGLSHRIVLQISQKEIP
jgi:hypothetical protein